MTRIIAPSILSADFGKLNHDIDMINDSKAEWFHVDVMDGVFVPNISFGFPVMNALKKRAQKTLDVHLMIVEPERYITAFADAGANNLTVHIEASTHLHRTLNEIRKHGMKAGIAINPHTPVSLLSDILVETDLVCLMSVNPGFGGQKFIEKTIEKTQRLREMIDQQNLNTLIEIDGGVSLENASTLFNAGANVLVAGNTVFSASDPQSMIERLLHIG